MIFFVLIGVVTLVSVAQLDHLTEDASTQTTSIEDSTEEVEDQVTPFLSTAVKDEDSFDDHNINNNKDFQNLHSKHPLLEQLPEQDVDRLRRAAVILRQRLIFRVWLDDHGLLEYATKYDFFIPC